MKLRLQIFAALYLIFSVKSKADDVALPDSEQGISSVEILEDNIANLDSPDMIEVLAHLKPPHEYSKPKSDEDESGKKSGKPGDDSKSKSKNSKTKKTSNGDKTKDKKEKPHREKSKVSKSKQTKEKPEDSKKETSEKDGKKDDGDVAKDTNQGKSNKTAKNSKSKHEITKTKDGDSKNEPDDKTKDGKSSKKSDSSDSEGGEKTKSNNDGKSDDNQKPDSDVTDDKAKMNKDDKSEGGQSSDEESDKASDEASKKADKIFKKNKPDKTTKAKEQTVSDAEKASHNDIQTVGLKKSKKKQQKASKKNKKKSKSKKKKAMTEMEKARDGATAKVTPDKTIESDSEKPDNDGSTSYSLESLKDICDVIDEPENEPASDDAEVDSAMRAFVPILTNKPEQDKSRRKKKKKISTRSKFLLGCEDAKPKDITKFDGQGGITTIYSQASKSRITIYCDNTTLGGGWTVFQRRVDGKLDFDRGYGAYQRGFGELSGEHWLGLDVIANITVKDKYALRLEMTDADGKKMIANYGEFSVGSQEKGYRLKISDFDGIRVVKDVLVSYDGQKFSTFNQDETKSQCGSRLQSGFWFDNCSTSSPNGKYFISPFKSRRPSGIYWKPVGGKFGPITQIEMKFRKKE